MLRLVIISCILTLSLGNSGPEVGKSLRKLSRILHSGKIIGGTDTDIKDIPYQLSIEYFGLQFCGASIVSEKYALSAAHCIEGTTRKELLEHSKYNGVTLDYDVFIIELEQLIVLSEVAQPIKPADEEPLPGTLVRIAGWGAIIEDGIISEVLQSITVPIYDLEDCVPIYSSLIPITPRMICGGEPGKHTCPGDDGGAVAFSGTIEGIISWGFGCGEEGYLEVYTSVTNNEIRDFIRDNTGI